MPTIDEIINSALNSTVKVEPPRKEGEKTAQAAPAETVVPEPIKIADELERLASGEKPENNTPPKETEKKASDVEMRKMAVAATIIDTLKSLDDRGVLRTSFSQFFQEKKHGS